MHSAPAVSYPMGRSRLHGLAILCFAVAGALVMLLWVASSDRLRWPHAAAVLLWLLGISTALWRWYCMPAGLLIWDAQAWYWTVDDQPSLVRPEVALDLQSWMLLRLRGSTAWLDLWVWPAHRDAPLQWQALRRALFCRYRASNQAIDPGVTADADRQRASP